MSGADRIAATAPAETAPASPTAAAAASSTSDASARMRGSVQVLTAAAMMGTLGPVAGVAYRTGIAGPT
ncbi:MAG: hypothetical protein MUE82_11860, partial [Chloroflexi bacterium]|nr:hypothetical protein [Chloroflexota bacterium]